jgi:hypothetical protein
MKYAMTRRMTSKEVVTTDTTDHTLASPACKKHVWKSLQSTIIHINRRRKNFQLLGVISEREPQANVVSEG